MRIIYYIDNGTVKGRFENSDTQSTYFKAMTREVKDLADATLDANFRAYQSTITKTKPLSAKEVMISKGLAQESDFWEEYT
jgi:hypothetical protein